MGWVFKHKNWLRQIRKLKKKIFPYPCLGFFQQNHPTVQKKKILVNFNMSWIALTNFSRRFSGIWQFNKCRFFVTSVLFSCFDWVFYIYYFTKMSNALISGISLTPFYLMTLTLPVVLIKVHSFFTFYSVTLVSFHF